MRHGDRVAVLSRTRLEWILLDWAVMSIGAVVVGLYPTSSAKECEYILEHCEAVLAFTEDEEQTRKLVSIRGSLPSLREVIPFDWLEKLEADGRLARHLQPGAGRRGRSCDADLHLGHDRPAEGLHAHAPQSRDGGACASWKA